MGFGTLLVFYLVSFLMSLNPYGSLFTLVGYVGMLMGLWELQQYQKTFLYAVYVTPAMLVVAIYKACRLLQASFGITVPFVTDTVTEVIKYAEYAVLLLFHAALLYAIHTIAHEIGLPKIKQGAVRNAVITGLYYVLYILALLPFGWVESYKKYAVVFVTLLPLVWVTLNAWLIYTCYRYICKEGDEDVPLRVSRFAFVNRIRAELERKEQKGIESALEHAQKNRQEHMEGKARNRELRIKYAERRDKLQSHKKKKRK